LTPQTPPEQVAPPFRIPPQTFVHDPQWSALLFRSQQPVEHFEPVLHVKSQVPALQVEVAFGTVGHATLHPPQLFTSPGVADVFLQPPVHFEYPVLHV
jgi:hypothetical protein